MPSFNFLFTCQPHEYKITNVSCSNHSLSGITFMLCGIAWFRIMCLCDQVYTIKWSFNDPWVNCVETSHNGLRLFFRIWVFSVSGSITSTHQYPKMCLNYACFRQKYVQGQESVGFVQIAAAFNCKAIHNKKNTPSYLPAQPCRGTLLTKFKHNTAEKSANMYNTFHHTRLWTFEYKTSYDKLAHRLRPPMAQIPS